MYTLKQPIEPGMLINRNFYPYFRVPENIHQLVKMGDAIMDPFFNHEFMTLQGVKVHWQSKDFQHLCKKFAESKHLDWYCWVAVSKFWPDHYQGRSTSHLHMGMSAGKFIVHRQLQNIIEGT